MRRSPAFQFYAAEYLADEHVQLMTLEQEGAYIRLLAFCWREGSIPKDLAALSSLCKGASTTLLTVVAKRFKQDPGNGERLIHPRLEAERIKQQEWREKSAKGGRKSGKARGRTAKESKQPEPELKGGSTIGQAAPLNPSSASSLASAFAFGSSGKDIPSPNGDGPSQKPKAVSPEDFTIWTLGINKLVATGSKEKTARDFIGKQVSQYGKPAVALAVTQALQHEAIEPKAYIVAVLQKQKGLRPGASKADHSMVAVNNVVAELEGRKCAQQQE